MESMEENSDKGVCILSFDSGGSGCYSQFLTIKRYMGRLATELDTSEEDVYPADHFDLMGGVGFGGLAAFMLGQLRMTVEEAEKAFLSITTRVFPGNSDVKASPEINTQTLKRAMEDMLEARKIPLDSRMYDKSRPPPKCKVALYVATSTNLTRSEIFRTYTPRRLRLNPTIVEALCATIAVPSIFLPVKIGPHMREQEFVGGAVGANNPTRELLKEAATIFGDNTRVAQIISVGAGKPCSLSPDSVDATSASGIFKSLVMDCETVAMELSNRLFNVDAYVRFNIPNATENPSMDDWGGLAMVESQTNAYLETSEVASSLDLSLKYLQNRVGTATLGQINYSSTAKLVVKPVPTLSPYYIIRQKEWDTVLHHLVDTPSSTQKVFSITGMAGCGKTQLVSYFMHEKGSLYPHTVFVDASSAVTLKSDLQAWSQALGPGHEQDVWEDALRALTSEIYRGKWILILDNADDPRLDLAPFIPNCYHGTVVITSRNRNVGDLANTYHLELGEMREDEAFSTLLKAAHRPLTIPPEETKSAHALAKQLGYLALALVQAGAYCHQLSSNSHGAIQPFTFAEYTILFISKRAELMKKAWSHSLDNYQLGAYAAFDISYQAVPQRAKEFLRFTSSFEHRSTSLSFHAAASEFDFGDPETLLPRPDDHRDVVSELEMLLRIDKKWSDTRAHEAIRTLRSFSLVSASSTANMVFIHLHPLIHAWARDVLLSQPGVYQRMATQVVTSCSPRTELGRYLLPHVHNALEASSTEISHVNDQTCAAVILREHGYYDKAEGLLIRVLEVLRQAGKAGKEEYLLAVADLAATYHQHGKWNDAESLGLDVLEGREGLLGQEHPQSILAANNLAVTYGKQGRYRDSEVLLLKVLEKREKLLGRGHPETMLSAMNLAVNYSNQGRYRESELLNLQVLEQQRRLLGQDHETTIVTAGNLAATYTKQGRYGEAEVLELDVLKQRRALLGREHPDAIRAAANLSTTYRNQGRYNEAEELDSEALQQRRGLLGQDHPDTILALANLAVTYSKQGRYGETEALELEVLEKRRRLLGEEHPETIQAAGNLATTYENQGRYEEAVALEFQVLEQQRSLLGRKHPDAIRSAGNLAALHRKQGHYGDAEVMELQVLEQWKIFLGHEHPETILSAGNLAATYEKQGRYGEAEVLQLKMLEQQRRLIGQDHPDTILTTANLAATYDKQGRYGEAEVLQLEVLEQRRRLLGREHPDTTLAMANLASTYREQGRYGESESLESGVLEQQRRLLGPEHPNTILAAGNLATTYFKQSRYGEAEVLVLGILEQRQRLLGPEHPDTILASADLAAAYCNQGRYGEAEVILLEVLEQRRKIVRPRASRHYAHGANLAATYRSQGRYREAEVLLLEVLEQYRRLLGREHPETIRTAASLAAVYNGMGRFDAAEVLQLEVLEQRRRLLGQEHPDTLLTMWHLAVGYANQRAWWKAAPLLFDAVTLSLRVLGKTHPSTKPLVSNLVFVLSEMGMTDAAEDIRELLL